MLMHQGIGLERFNALPHRGAVHALYESCCSVAWAGRVADGRPYDSYDALLQAADTELFELPVDVVEQILECHPVVARRARTTSSTEELCAVWAPDSATMWAVLGACAAYELQFGFPYVWLAAGRDAADLLTDLEQRREHSAEVEWKTMLGELAKVNRTRILRMLGPEDGYDNYA